MFHKFAERVNRLGGVTDNVITFLFEESHNGYVRLILNILSMVGKTNMEYVELAREICSGDNHIDANYGDVGLEPRFGILDTDLAIKYRVPGVVAGQEMFKCYDLDKYDGEVLPGWLQDKMKNDLLTLGFKNAYDHGDRSLYYKKFNDMYEMYEFSKVMYQEGTVRQYKLGNILEC